MKLTERHVILHGNKIKACNDMTSGVRICQLHQAGNDRSLLEMFKFITEKNGPKCNLKLNFHSTLASTYDTRDNIYKLTTSYCKYEI